MRATLLALALAFGLGAAPSAMAEVRLPVETGATARVSVVSWRDMKFRTVVRQMRDYSCGSAAVATLLTHHYNRPTTEADAFAAMWAVGDQASIRRAGFSMLDMRTYLRGLGLPADGYRPTFEQLAELKRPAIVLITSGAYKHFVVVKGVERDRVLLGDPARGLRSVSRAEFEKMWNGAALLLGGKPGRFSREDEWLAVEPVSARLAPAPGFTGEVLRDAAQLYQISRLAPERPL